jgi:hypothetical protein
METVLFIFLPALRVKQNISIFSLTKLSDEHRRENRPKGDKIRRDEIR